MGSELKIANEIVRQLGGAGRLAAMINAKNFIGYGDERTDPGVTFKHMAGAQGANFTRVVLDRATDTYTVEIGKVRGSTVKMLHEVSGVYADTLRNVIETRTGLALSLGARS